MLLLNPLFRTPKQRGGHCYLASVCVVLLGLLSTGDLLAQPTLRSLSAQWIQRGTSLDLTLGGDRLSAVTGVVFSGEAGLSATLPLPPSVPRSVVAIESASGAFSVAPAPKPDNSKSLTIHVAAATNAVLGSREIRVVSASGISAPLSINVGALPELNEREPNNRLDEAQEIALPATINGAISVGTEVDSFKFKATKGQTIVLDVDASQRGSALDSTLVLYDTKGRELARSEDVNGFDSLLNFTVPDSGEFVAQIRDFEYRGGGNFTYRLHVGALPYVDSVFPMGGARGKPVDLALIGQNLAGAEKVTLNIDPQSPLGRQELRLKLPQGFSNPISFDVQDLPEIVEVATNATNAISIPAMVNGRLEAANDIDYFKFKAEADQRIIIEVSARRYGSPLDALLFVYANGSLVAQNDDASGADARAEIDVKKGTEYVVAVRDLTQRGGSAFTYRMSLRAPQPSFAASFYPDRLQIHRNGLARIKCEVSRAGFDGPVRLVPQGFPAGIIAEPLVVSPGQTSGTLLISASEATVTGTVPIAFTATTTLNGKEVTLSAAALNGDAPDQRVKQAFVTVREPAPFSMDAVTLSAVLDQGQSTNLDLAILRDAGFSGDIKVSLDGYSLGREVITKSFDVAPITLKDKTTTARFNLKAKKEAEVGTRNVFAIAEWVANGETNLTCSRPIPVTVQQIPFVLSAVTPRAFLTLPRAGSTSAVEEVTVKFKAERRGYNGEIPLTLDGIPDGITISDAKVPAGSGEAAVRLLPSGTAKPGTNYSFTASAVVTHQDRIYRQKSGAVKLFIETPAAIEFAANTNAPAAK